MSTCQQPLSVGRVLAFVLTGVTAAGCTNFHVVEEGKVYRSAQPRKQQLETWIWRYDLETVVHLRNGDMRDDTYRASFEPTVTAGIDFVQIPLSALRFPEDQAMVRLCDVFEHGRYPMLFHCMAGADRTSLVSAMYVLHRTGDVSKAREELALVPYLHLGWFGADKADLVIDMYEPWEGVMTFCDWARQVYEQPPGEGIPDGYLEAQRARAAEVAKAKATPE